MAIPPAFFLQNFGTPSAGFVKADIHTPIQNHRRIEQTDRAQDFSEQRHKDALEQQTFENMYRMNMPMWQEGWKRSAEEREQIRQLESQFDAAALSGDWTAQTLAWQELERRGYKGFDVEKATEQQEAEATAQPAGAPMPASAGQPTTQPVTKEERAPALDPSLPAWLNSTMREEGIVDKVQPTDVVLDEEPPVAAEPTKEVEAPAPQAIPSVPTSPITTEPNYGGITSRIVDPNGRTFREVNPIADRNRRSSQAGQSLQFLATQARTPQQAEAAALAVAEANGSAALERGSVQEAHKRGLDLYKFLIGEGGKDRRAAVAASGKGAQKDFSQSLAAEKFLHDTIITDVWQKHGVNKIQDGLHAANRIGALSASGNAISEHASVFQYARTAQGSGVLSDKDMQRIEAAKGPLDKAEELWNRWVSLKRDDPNRGRLSEAYTEQIKIASSIMQKVYKENLLRAAVESANAAESSPFLREVLPSAPEIAYQKTIGGLAGAPEKAIKQSPGANPPTAPPAASTAQRPAGDPKKKASSLLDK
jgi:hypothetical protein